MLDFWRLPAFRVCLAALAVGLMLLGPLLAYAPLEVTGLSTLLPVQVIVLFTGFALASVTLLVRYRHDASRPALAFKWGASRMFDFMAANLFLMVYTAVAVPLCYLTFSLAFPMQDAAYAAFDLAVGFDFEWWVRFANDNPAIGQLLIWSYASFVGQLFVVISLLSLWSANTRA